MPKTGTFESRKFFCIFIWEQRKISETRPFIVVFLTFANLYFLHQHICISVFEMVKMQGEQGLSVTHVRPPLPLRHPWPWPALTSMSTHALPLCSAKMQNNNWHALPPLHLGRYAGGPIFESRCPSQYTKSCFADWRNQLMKANEKSKVSNVLIQVLPPSTQI